MNTRFFASGITARSWAAGRQRGTSMVEVLVTLIILAVGLLGLAGLQSRLQASEMDAYQRAQALILLQDMASRLTANRANAEDYITGDDAPLGTGNECPTSTATRQEIDSGEWCNALLGASEESSTASNVGAMVGGRGCITDLPGDGEYLITVAWQGLTPVSAPPEGVGCGKDLYDGGNCVDDRCRRVVTTVVRVANLAS